MPSCFFFLAGHSHLPVPLWARFLQWQVSAVSCGQPSEEHILVSVHQHLASLRHTWNFQLGWDFWKSMLANHRLLTIMFQTHMTFFFLCIAECQSCCFPHIGINVTTVFPKRQKKSIKKVPYDYMDLIALPMSHLTFLIWMDKQITFKYLKCTMI